MATATATGSSVASDGSQIPNLTEAGLAEDGLVDGLLPCIVPEVGEQTNPPSMGRDRAQLDSSEQGEESKKKIRPLIRRVSERTEEKQYVLLQQWEGVVDSVTEDTVWAEICDLTDLANPPEVVEFAFSELSQSDMPLLKPGAVFYWSIGYETTVGGTRRRFSEIRARRTPEWSQRAIDAMAREGQAMFERFGDCSADDSSSR